MSEETEEKKYPVNVYPVKLEPHPNADKLSIVRIEGWQCVVATADWLGIELAAYLPPDSLVKANRPEFSWLASKANSEGLVRIKAIKLRGELSFGLLIPAPTGTQVGDDVSVVLEVGHWNPTAAQINQKGGGLFTSGESRRGPDLVSPKYDLEAGRKYAAKVFTENEPIWCSEKIHGCNSRYVYSNGEMFCGSRTLWKKEFPSYEHVTLESLLATGKVDEERAKEIIEKLKDKPNKKNQWWHLLDSTPGLREFCQANPDHVIYGELAGAVGGFPYGTKPGEIRFFAFDIMRNGKWMDVEDAMTLTLPYNIPWAPSFNKVNVGDDGLVTLDPIPYNFDVICMMAEGKSTVDSSHVREGVVVKPLKERNTPNGRAALKWVGAGYLMKSSDEVTIEE